MLGDYSIIDLLYEANRDILDTCEHADYASGGRRVVLTLKRSDALPIDSFYVDLLVDRQRGEEGRIVYDIVNGSDNIDNIQFSVLCITGDMIDEDIMRLRVDYAIDETKYAKFILRTLNNIVSNMFQRFLRMLSVEE